MVNDNVHPKAVNIIRPTHSLSVKRAPQSTQSSTLPRIVRSAKVHVDERPYGSKPQLNIYRPPPKRSQSQMPSTVSFQRLQPKPSVPAARSNKPSFEVYKPPIKQTLSRSTTTPALNSVSTPSSIPNHYHRQRPQQPVQPSVPPAHMSRSVTHHSIASSTVRSFADSSDDDDSDGSDGYFDSQRHPSFSDADTLVTNTPTTPGDEKLSDESENDDDNEDSVIKEARVNRKVADLEISNRSLLAVNQMLEMTVKRQASQMAKLKQQLDQDGVTDFTPVVSPVQQSEQKSDDEWEEDGLFLRIRQMTETMIESGTASLQYECTNLGGRVLSRYPLTDENEARSPENEAFENDATDKLKSLMIL